MLSRAQQLRGFDPVLTNLARGYRQPNLIADSLFPIVPMLKEGSQVPQFGKEAFRAYAAKRALRGKSNRLPASARSYIAVTMEEYDMEDAVDYRELDEDILPLEQQCLRRVQDIIFNGREFAAATLAQTLGNYGSNNKNTLSGNSRWTVQATSDPVADSATAKNAIATATGMEPNTLVLGRKAWNALKIHPKILDAIRYTKLGVAKIADVAELLEIPNIVVGRAIKASDADVFSDVWGDNAIWAYTTQTPADQLVVGEPSFGYTFRKPGHPWADSYTENGGKLKVVRCTDNMGVQIVGADAGYLLTGCCAAA